jgi:hypothetical protein
MKLHDEWGDCEVHDHYICELYEMDKVGELVIFSTDVDDKEVKK